MSDLMMLGLCAVALVSAVGVASAVLRLPSAVERDLPWMWPVAGMLTGCALALVGVFADVPGALAAMLLLAGVGLVVCTGGCRDAHRRARVASLLPWRLASARLVSITPAVAVGAGHALVRTPTLVVCECDAAHSVVLNLN
jgi:hypothetical protein